jgi:hypothetical protein
MTAMIQRLLLLALSLFALLNVVTAQDATPTVPPAPQREIYTVLGYGDGVFETDLWLASAEETPNRTRATWRSDNIGGVAFADYLHFETGVTPDQFDTLFGADWFNATLSNFAVWREETRCDLGNLRLIQYTLQIADTNYSMRYWIEWVSDTRVMTLYVVVPDGFASLLDTYGARLYPDLASCSAVG